MSELVATSETAAHPAPRYCFARRFLPIRKTYEEEPNNKAIFP